MSLTTPISIRPPRTDHVHKDATAIVASVGRTVVMVVDGYLSPDAIWAMHHASTALGRKGPVATIAVVGPNIAIPPAPETRLASEAATKQAPRTLVASATVLLASGFFGAALRSVVTGIELVAAKGQSRRTFGTFEEAVQFTGRALDSTEPERDLVRELVRALAVERGLLLSQS